VNVSESEREQSQIIRRQFCGARLAVHLLIPFNVTIPPEERDPDLAEKLKAEAPGILAWMIQGCLDWQRERLSPPPVVCEATEAYLASENSVANWIEDCCDQDRNAWESSTALFASWVLWADKAGEPLGTQRDFTQNLESQGFTPVRGRDEKGKRLRGFRGLKLRQ
jgi:putative DNA primase/helicase